MLMTTLLGGLVPALAAVLFALCLAVSAVGFYRTVYFISIGYGFSMAAMAILTMGIGWRSADPITWIQAALLAAYGLRLGIYLVGRETKASYRASQKGDSRENGTRLAAKQREPNRFCGSGLYRLVRCPNYFGEILVWSGSLIAGAGLTGNWAMWTLSGIGYAFIFYVMIGSTRRLELKQDERYGSDPEYAEYARKVPVLFPLIPLYSLKKAKAFLS